MKKLMTLFILLFGWLAPAYTQLIPILWDKTVGDAGGDEAIDITLNPYYQYGQEPGYVVGGRVGADLVNEGDYDENWVIKTYFFSEWGNTQLDFTVMGERLNGYYNTPWLNDLERGYGYGNQYLIGDKLHVDYFPEEDSSASDIDFYFGDLTKYGWMGVEKTYGGPGDDEFPTFEINGPRTLLGGTSESGIGRDKTEASRGGSDYWIVSISSLDGDLIWDKTFGGSGNDNLADLVYSSNRRAYLLVGSSRSSSSGEKSDPQIGGNDLWIILMDVDGNKIWDKTYGGTGNDVPTDVIATSDGGFLIAAYSNSGAGPYKSQASKGGSDFWLLKLDGYGQIEWEGTFGGAGTERTSGLQEVPGKGYVVGGYSNSGISGDKSESSRGGFDYWVMQVDLNGNFLWDRTVGGSRADYLSALLVDEDESIVLAGTSYSHESGDKSDTNPEHCRDCPYPWEKFDPDIWVVKLGAPPVQKVLYYNASATDIYKDSEGRNWAPDAYFSNSKSNVVSSEVDIENTLDDAIYRTERWGSDFWYQIPDLPNGQYEVELHFAEVYFDQPGQRVFSVQAEDLEVRTNYDIVQAAREAGDEDGVNYAIVEKFNAMVSDGVLFLKFFTGPDGKNRAKVNGISLKRIGRVRDSKVKITRSTVECTADGLDIEVRFQMEPPGDYLIRNAETGEVLATGYKVKDQLEIAHIFLPGPVQAGQLALELRSGVPGQKTQGKNILVLDLPDCPPTGAVCLNANGTENYLATDNTLFGADNYFEGGGEGTASAPIDNTEDDLLFHTERVGKQFAYRIPVAGPAAYTVDLYFAETELDRSNFRLFDVAAEGSIMLSAYDIFLEALRASNGAQGMNYALIESFPVAVTDGTLDLIFQARKNRAKVNAICVRPLNADFSDFADFTEVGLRAEEGGDSNRFEPVSDLRLLPNYPNPFREATTIPFVLAEAGEATLRFFDLNGRLLGEIRREFPAGLNQVEVGRELLPQAGVLLYHLTFGGERRTGRMIRLE